MPKPKRAARSGSNYTKAQCIAALRRFRRENGQTAGRLPYQNWSAGKGVPSRGVLQKVLGGSKTAAWEVVLEAAGYVPATVEEQRRKKIATFGRRDCIAALKACRKALGRAPRQSEYAAWHKQQAVPAQLPSALTIVRFLEPRFPKRQQWIKVLVAARISPGSLSKKSCPRRPKRGGWDTRELIVHLKQCAEDSGDVPSSYCYDEWRERRVGPENPIPTQTTLRRYLGRTQCTWKNVLRAARLDPRLISCNSRGRLSDRQRKVCSDAVAECIAHFGGRPDGIIYQRWAFAHGKPSFGSVLYWLANDTRKFEDALDAVEPEPSPRITVDLAEARNGMLPDLPSAQRCREALREFRAESSGVLSAARFALWAETNQSDITVIGLLFRFSPAAWRWSEVLAHAS